jgi:integrase/recombinase XerD
MARTRKADLWDLVNDYFDIHLKDVRRMSGGTILTYRYGLFSFVLNFANFVHRPFDRIEPEY